ncbi:DUF2264 domain-containing protein [Cerasicoccus frondis]|uniref:DUF2264 domain-containing protein n=1 Tax=Cerasicoccus frondis TaxID=490090 RepID=UPI00285254CA|nr:DUF2264 domain-containing protein [Cerasicoccus frondis]
MIAPPEHAVASSRWLTDRALRLLRPLMTRINPGEAKLDLQGRASDHDARADRLESFARPFHLYALLLGHLGENMPDEAANWRDQLSLALQNGADKNHPAHWGPSTNFHQHVVEMGLLVLSLEISREHFWNKLNFATQSLVLDWLETARSVAMHWNNHMFFGVYTLEFLRKEGRARRGDQALIDGWMRELETMYRDSGWFRDGLNDSADYYNAYAFHYYGLNWALFFGQDRLEQCEFWASRADEFLSGFHYVFAEDGGVPNFGRSQTYRFATLAPYGPALMLDCCPTPHSHVRRLSEDHLDFFLDKEIFTPEGWLNIGWTDENPAIAETYSCVSSTYWAAKGFSLLLLPPDHLFWQSEPASKESVYSDGHTHTKGVGLTIRRFAGDTEIINSGSAIALMNLRYFASKWSKLAYRASAGTVLPDRNNPHPLDLSLVAEFGDLRLGRHLTNPTEYGDDFIRCAYTLGQKTFDEMVAVETHIAWKGPWLYIEHTIHASAPCTLKQGGFALGFDEIGSAKIASHQSDQLILRRGKDTAALQTITGFSSLSATPDSSHNERRHTLYQRHLIPVAETEIGAGETKLACLIYYGPSDERARPWTALGNKESLHLNHPFYNDWHPSHA